ncbi:MAG: hypothetical protein P8Z42_03225 [Anaerolineales bacterium]
MMEYIETSDHARQVADPIAVRVIERLRIDFVEDGLFQPFGVQFGFGDDGDFDLVDDRSEIIVVAGVQDVAEVLQIEAFFGGRLADADPGNVALTDVLDAGPAVDDVVDLAFEHRLEIFFHLASGDFHQNAQIHAALVFQFLETVSDDFDLAVIDFIHVFHEEVLEGPAVFAAEFDAHVRLAYDLAFEGRPVSDWHRHFTDRDPGGQNFGNHRIGDDGKSVGDRPGGRGIFKIVDLAQGQHEGENAELVVQQDVAPLAAFHAPESERGSSGETQRVDRPDGVAAEGNDIRVVSHLHIFFHQLVDDRTSVDVAYEKGENVSLLEFANDGDGGCVGVRRASDGCEAGHAPVHQLDAPGAQLDIVDRPVEMSVSVGPGTVVSSVWAREGRRSGQRESGIGLRLLAMNEADTFDDLFGKQRGHTGVQRLAEIRRPKLFIGYRVEQIFCVLQGKFHVPQRTDLVPEHSQNNGQIIRRIGEGDRRIAPLFLNGLRQCLFCLRYDGVGASNSASCNVT